MAKRRIRNNFKKWSLKSVPFFLIVFFVFFNISFFVFNSSTYEKKTNGLQSGSLKKISRDSSFGYIRSLDRRDDLKQMIEVYKIEKDEYPNNLEDIRPGFSNKNWIYTKSSDRYILEYKE